jgi:ERF superfamily
MAEKKLAAKLAEIMKEVGYIQKGGTNSAQGYKYVMASQVADAIREKLADKNIILVPVGAQVIETGRTPSEKQSLLTLKYTWRFIDGDSGETIDFESVGSGADSGDKAPYKAATGALKYALLTAFLIPTGDDPENDSVVAAAAKEIFNSDVVKPVADKKPASKKATGQWEGVEF